MTLYATEPKKEHDLILIEEDWDVLHPLMKRLATKMAEKGIYVSSSIGSTSLFGQQSSSATLPNNHEESGHICFYEADAQQERKIHYGTSSAKDGWDDYEEIGDQMKYSLKALDGVEAGYANDRGSAFIVYQLPDI